jgi:hypothetical protein
MSAAEIAYIVACVLAVAAIYKIGYCTGAKRGAAIGWLERQEEIWRDEKARRDARGRFQRKGQS